MIHAGYALIRRPAFLRFDSRLTERNVGFVRTYMYPTGAVVASPFASNVEFRKGRFQETDHRVHVADANVRMFKPGCHRIPPQPAHVRRSFRMPATGRPDGSLMHAIEVSNQKIRWTLNAALVPEP